MPRPFERVIAILCYLGAVRVLFIALAVPEQAFAVPSGLFVAGAAWLYGRKRSPFLLHHAREGLRWSLQANLLMAGLTLLSKLLYFAWSSTGIAAFYELWHFGATIFRWAGVLTSILTAFAMYRAARGSIGDAFTLME